MVNDHRRKTEGGINMARYPDRVRRPSPYLEKAAAHRTDDFGTIPEAPLVPAFPYQRGRVTDCCDESVADTDYVGMRRTAGPA